MRAYFEKINCVRRGVDLLPTAPHPAGLWAPGRCSIKTKKIIMRTIKSGADFLELAKQGKLQSTSLGATFQWSETGLPGITAETADMSETARKTPYRETIEVHGNPVQIFSPVPLSGYTGKVTCTYASEKDENGKWVKKEGYSARLLVSRADALKG